MAFGPIMRVGVGELTIELAPIARKDLKEFVSPGMQQAVVTRFLGTSFAPVLEDEFDWFEKVRTQRDSLVWGIYNVAGEKRAVIGVTSATNIAHYCGVSSTVTGSQIFRPELWGKGIASAIHKARTWYLCQHVGLCQIRSGVLHGNIASRKALEKVGYRPTYVERNFKFANGKLRHQQYLECINPNEPFWSAWWGEDTPSKAALKARERSLETFEWAKENVTL